MLLGNRSGSKSEMNDDMLFDKDKGGYDSEDDGQEMRRFNAGDMSSGMEDSDKEFGVEEDDNGSFKTSSFGSESSDYDDLEAEVRKTVRMYDAKYKFKSSYEQWEDAKATNDQKD